MKKLTVLQMEKIEGGKFWGWGDQYCVAGESVFNPVTNSWDPTKKMCKDHYIFWIIDQTDCTISSGSCGGVV